MAVSPFNEIVKGKMRQGTRANSEGKPTFKGWVEEWPEQKGKVKEFIIT